MCGGVHYGEVEGLVCVERWSCGRDASCVVEYTMGRLREVVCIISFHAGGNCDQRRTEIPTNCGQPGARGHCGGPVW